jgi:hypothetical protein
MKQLKQETMKWLEERFGKELYNDLSCKQTIEDAADYFLENISPAEIEEWGGIDCALESWTYAFISAEELESLYSKNQIEMLQANACAANEGRPHVYTEDEIDEA